MNKEYMTKESSNYFPTRYDKIRSVVDSGETSNSISMIEEFLLENPDHPEAHNDLAILYYRTGNKLQTLGHYEKAVRLSPQNISFKKNLASFYFVEMGWTDDAITIYTDIINKYPDDSETLGSLGIISMAVGRPEEAKTFFQRLIELEPWNNEARQAFESLCCPGKITTVPVSTNNQASPVVRPDSNMDDILSNLRKTISQLETANASEPIQNSKSQEIEGSTDGAIHEFETILKSNPDNSLIHNDLAVLYFRDGNFEKSLRHHQIAVALNPRNSTFRKNLANIYYSVAGRTDEAIRIYVELLHEFPDDVETLGALAIISKDNNRFEEAKVFLRKILETEPDNNDARALLAGLSTGKDQGFFLTNR